MGDPLVASQFCLNLPQCSLHLGPGMRRNGDPQGLGQQIPLQPNLPDDLQQTPLQVLRRGHSGQWVQVDRVVVVAHRRHTLSAQA